MAAAMVAANRVPAIPARNEAPAPPQSRASAAVRRSTRTGSGPHNRPRPSIWTSNSPKAASAGSIVPAIPGLNAARASKAASAAAPSASGSGSTKRLRRESMGVRQRDPPLDAERPGARVRVDHGPRIHGRPPSTSGPGGKGSEARAIASSSGRCGR